MTCSDTDITIRVVGNPGPGGSKKPVNIKKKGGGTQTILVPASKLTKPWMDSVRCAADAVWNGRPLIDAPVRFLMAFYIMRPGSHFTPKGELKKSAPEYPHKRRQGDLLKLGRSTEDALTGVVWRDDKLVVKEQLTIDYADWQGALLRIIVL